ncbi:MAG TPA: response regulator, partial [Verrucomicrobiae bacterium]|nr:response regulator [Verrucomicrobiae bacterium]
MQPRILLIEDDPSTASALEKVLQAEGYRVALNERGDQGLTQAQEPGFDLVITDLKLPGLSGLELVRQLHTLRPRLPVILMTAHGTT